VNRNNSSSLDDKPGIEVNGLERADYNTTGDLTIQQRSKQVCWLSLPRKILISASEGWSGSREI